MKRNKSRRSNQQGVTTINVGRGKGRREIPIIFEPHALTPEENDARIKRLSRKILEVVEHARREHQSKKGSSLDANPLDDVSNSLFDE